LKKAIVSVPGKCILLGEHAVVHGYSAIAVAIKIFSTCEIISNSNETIDFLFINEDKKFSISNQNLREYSLLEQPQEYSQFIEGLRIFSEKFSVKIESIIIKLSSDLWKGAGLGSSASTAVALLATLGKFYSIDLKKEHLSDLAFELEKIVHGKPSGIDNTVCSYGGIISYENQIPKSIEIKNFPNNEKIALLLTNSGKIHDTKLAIEKVSNLLKNSRNSIELIFSKIGELAKRSLDALLHNNFKTLGKLMNQNHKYLKELSLSTPEIEEIRSIIENTNCFGSKLTGAGLGGAVVSIGFQEDLKCLSTMLNERGYTSILTEINFEGPIKHEK
jgi:mevalonate kinase